MFKTLFKGIRAKSENEKNKESDKARNVKNTATKGITLGSRLEINDLILAKSPGLIFNLGSKVKEVTGVSRDDDRGENTVRFYTNDDYFLQINFHGDDEQENIQDAMIFHYLDDECESIDQNNEEQIAKWQALVTDQESIEVEGQVFTRIDSSHFEGLEVVELDNDEINPITNFFNVFKRDVTPTITEYLIVNLEQEVDLDHETGEITNYGDATGSMAIGSDLPLMKVKVNNANANQE